MTPSETISLTRWIFVGKVMSLIFNMLSRLVVSFLPRSKHLLISWLQSPTAVTLEPPKIKFLTLWWHYCRHPPRELIPYPGLLNPEPQPLWQATADLYLHRSHSNTQGQVWLSLCGFSWWAKPFVWALWASLAGMGFDSKHNFTPPTILLGLLCPWMWGISSQLLQCCATAAPVLVLSNSMKLWAMPCRAKTDRSWWRVLTKHGPLEKGMANHFSILALRIPWTVWKGKKIGHWKTNSPGL